MDLSLIERRHTPKPAQFAKQNVRGGDDDLPARPSLATRRAKTDALRARQAAADSEDDEGAPTLVGKRSRGEEDEFYQVPMVMRSTMRLQLRWMIGTWVVCINMWKNTNSTGISCCSRCQESSPAPSLQARRSGSPPGGPHHLRGPQNRPHHRKKPRPHSPPPPRPQKPAQEKPCQVCQGGGPPQGAGAGCSGGARGRLWWGGDWHQCTRVQERAVLMSRRGCCRVEDAAVCCKHVLPLRMPLVQRVVANVVTTNRFPFVSPAALVRPAATAHPNQPLLRLQTSTTLPITLPH